MIFIQIVYKQRMLISQNIFYLEMIPISFLDYRPNFEENVLKWVGLKMHLFGFQTTYYHADTS